jgi:hypothetical protein
MATQDIGGKFRKIRREQPRSAGEPGGQLMLARVALSKLWEEDH